jgi:uncharacterized protein (DUF58 family)
MIPSLRLLWCVAAMFPVAVVSGAWAIGAGAVLGAAAALDAWLSRRRLDGLRASMPPARLHKDRPAVLELQLEHPAAREVRAGIAWPGGMEAAMDEQIIAAPGRARWSITPRRRGDYTLAVVYCSGASRFGLWEVRRACPLDAHIQVFPNLQTPDELLAIRSYATGEHARRQLGRGREFEHLREYVPGDGSDEIDWKATARRGKPITRVFQVERTQDVYAVVDASRLTGRPAGFEPRLERYVQAALALGAIAMKQGDRFGLITFTDRVHDLVRSGRGAAQSTLCRQALYRLHAAPVPADFEDVASQLRLQVRGRALLVFLTDLDDPATADGFAKAAALLARKHLVAAISIRPETAEPLFTRAASGDDDMYRQIGGHLQWKKLQETQSRLRSQGVLFRLAERDSLSRELGALYDEIKQRQML